MLMPPVRPLSPLLPFLSLQVSCFLNLFCPLVPFLLIYFSFLTRNAADLSISSVLPFLHLAIHLLPLIFFHHSLCLHLFALPVSSLVSASMGSKEPTRGKTICCQCLSFASSSTCSFTHSQSHRFQIPVSLSTAPSPRLSSPPLASHLSSHALVGAGGRG